MWERTLQDLIRGLRANKNDERKFIAQAIEEIRREVKSKDMELKAGAILKMTFLDMLGYDLTWANFNIIEVMSSPKYHLKSIGYLAASQSFNQETDVLMLTTNLLKKDLSSVPGDTALALAGLSQFVTPDLARDLTQELNAMLNHSRAAIRKRVVLALFKVIRQYPEALPYCLPRLKEKLEDPDPSVVSSTVNMFCELARRNPQDFLILAPPLFHILTTSSNNWMLIKVIKLFGAISPYEPRLVKKLQAPITDLIQTTSAISLLYECVHTCIIGGMLDGFNGLALARICVTQLSTFLENDDQNLKYIALNTMAKIVPIRPELVAEHQAVILSSLEDFDISIRIRALELISSMASPNNNQFLVQQLLSHLAKSDQSSLPSATATLSRVLQTGTTSEGAAPTQTQAILSPAYRLEIANQIINMCSRNMYENVQDFDWYLSVLLDLVYVAGTNIASITREQLVNVTARVQDSRNYACRLMVRLLDDDSLLLNADDPTKCSGVLWAAAWICGEYSEELSDAQYTLQRLIQPSVSLLPSDIIAVYIQAILKVFARWCSELASNWTNDVLPRVKRTVGETFDFCHSFVSHEDIEVQERAANATQLFTMIKMDLEMFKPQPELHPQPEFQPEPEQSDYPDFANEFSDLDPTRNPPSHSQSQGNVAPSFPKSLLLLQHLFSSYSLRPLPSEVQKRVRLPDKLDLNEWFVPPSKQELETSDNRERKKKKIKGKTKDGAEKGKSQSHIHSTHTPYTDDQLEKEAENITSMRAERLARQKEDPYYLKESRPASRSQRSHHDIDSIPIVKLDDMPPLIIESDQSAPSSRPPETTAAVYNERFEAIAGSASESGSRSASPYPKEVSAEGTTAGLLSPDAIVVKRTKKKTSGKKKAIESSL